MSTITVWVLVLLMQSSAPGSPVLLGEPTTQSVCESSKKMNEGKSSNRGLRFECIPFKQMKPNAVKPAFLTPLL